VHLDRRLVICRGARFNSLIFFIGNSAGITISNLTIRNGGSIHEIGDCRP
jgi:hypothetical protein